MLEIEKLGGGETGGYFYWNYPELILITAWHWTSAQSRSLNPIHSIVPTHLPVSSSSQQLQSPPVILSIQHPFGFPRLHCIILHFYTLSPVLPPEICSTLLPCFQIIFISKSQNSCVLKLKLLLTQEKECGVKSVYFSSIRGNWVF